MTTKTELTRQLDTIIQLLQSIDSKLTPKQKPAQNTRDVAETETILTPDEKKRVLMLVRYYSESPDITRLTATQIAERCNIEPNKSELMAIGRLVLNSGHHVRKRRSGMGRYFVFSSHLKP